MVQIGGARGTNPGLKMEDFQTFQFPQIHIFLTGYYFTTILGVVPSIAALRFIIAISAAMQYKNWLLDLRSRSQEFWLGDRYSYMQVAGSSC
jgi:hypothetical protein